MLFPRWTGPKGNPNVLMGKASLVNYIQTYNGRKACTVSVYAFNRFRNQKPVIQSAMIDVLYVIGKPEKMLNYSQLLADNDIRYTARYTGNDLDIIVPLGTVVKSLHREVKQAQQIVNIPFSTRTWDLMLWSRTWNPKSKKYVIDVLPTDNIDDLPDLASQPLKRKRVTGQIIRGLYT